MFRTESRKLVLSVGDLVRAGRCEYAVLCDLDVELGRSEPTGLCEIDGSWRKILVGGRRHERRQLGEYQRQFGRNSVVEVDRPRAKTGQELEVAASRTLAALRNGARVIYQAVVFDGQVLGFADFLRVDDDGRWQVEDTKLSVTATFEAQMQVAAYSALLGAAGVRLRDDGVLVLGDGTRHDVRLDDVLPAFVASRERTVRLTEEHIRSARPAEFGAGDIRYCGDCARCRTAIEQRHDVLQVAGVGTDERTLLRAAGIDTAERLASSASQPIPGLTAETFDRLRRQAALQLRPGELPNAPAFDVVRPRSLGSLPPADPGDLFLSFPAQSRMRGEDDDPDHLFGASSVDDVYRSYWGDDRHQDTAQFLRFLAELRQRRAQHPRMHVYHYSSLDRPHLYDLAQRAGAGESAIDELVEDGVLVDLYSIVSTALEVGTPDLSLRQVARLVDPEGAWQLPAGDVKAERAEYRRLRAQLDEEGAAQLRSRLERENRERCMLTRRLRDLLLELGRREQVPPGAGRPARARKRRSPQEQQLIEALFSVETAARSEVAAAAIEYHEREDSVFWRSHFRRLGLPTEHWSGRVRGALRIDLIRVEEEWTTGARGGVSRVLRVRTTAAPGTVLQVGARPFLVYDGPALFEAPRATPGSRSATDAEVLEQAGEGEYLVRERIPRGAEPWARVPAALAPDRPPKTTAIRAAVRAWAANLAVDTELPCAVTALIDRTPPRTTADGLLRTVGAEGQLDLRASLVGSIERLDSSYLAVQGPPGSGKTTTGAQAIADLLARGWRIGVVAQSHAVVEHFLDRVVDAGAPSARVAKHVRATAAPLFTGITRRSYRSFMQRHGDGFVIGGTAWDFTNDERVRPGELDLLVIDEAGQFGLVDAIAVGRAARNLLLLGDPQQLPQVSQAVHRAAVDRSALGWLLDDEAVLPERFGFFLGRTWRMHPVLTRAVSDLSYDRRLAAHDATSARSLESIVPGLHLRPRRHLGSTDASTEEADEVVRIVREVLGKPWRDGRETRRTGEQDVIVVAPYNAQVECIRAVLRAAGHPGVEVGTVDRFQGREAVVAVYSTTVSTLSARPQAAHFVLGRNRLNVAISRAQWAAYVVHSTQLTNYSARNADDAAALSRFLRLCEFATSAGGPGVRPAA